jgi:DNA polymerase-3 subunit gamma/tau
MEQFLYRLNNVLKHLRCCRTKAITNTLLNAIESNHLLQLLFTDLVLVKQLAARILASKNKPAGYDDPNEDFAFNVFELDAASNNSDDIRN